MIRSSNHSICFANCGKISKYTDFLLEYRRISSLFVEYVWNGNLEGFSPISDKLNNCPKFFDYRALNIETKLSARTLRTLTGQVLEIIKGCTKKRKNIIYLFNNGKIDQSTFDKLSRKYPLRKPNVSNINPILNSICCDIEKGKYFDIFVSLKSIGKHYGKIKIPIKNTKVSNKWSNFGNTLSGIRFSDKTISISYEIEEKNKPLDSGIVIGIDQGVKTVATLSNGIVTPDINSHNYSFDLICDILSRKKKGSKAFKRAQEHRKNFINWALNMIDWTGIKEIHLEKIWNIGFKKIRSRKLSHFTNTLIRDKIKSIAEELEVPIVEQDSTYRSQRCSNCGIVRKSNRKSKEYSCKHCNNVMDADLNAAKNHEINLPNISWMIRGQKYNLGNGFYWLQDGLYNFDGSELTVSDSNDKRVLKP